MTTNPAQLEALERRIALLEKSRKRLITALVMIGVGAGLVAATPGRRVLHARSVQAEEFVVLGTEGLPVAKLGLGFSPDEIRDEGGRLESVERAPGLYFAADPVWVDMPLRGDSDPGATAQLYVYPPALDAEMARGVRTLLAPSE